MRWEHEAKSAAEHLGWTVVESDGVSDYQGWGALLLTRPSSSGDPYGSVGTGDEWAVLAWSYGSCGGCDAYEEAFYGLTDDQYVETCERCFGTLIEVSKNEEAARAKYDDAKGW